MLWLRRKTKVAGVWRWWEGPNDRQMKLAIAVVALHAPSAFFFPFIISDSHLFVFFSLRPRFRSHPSPFWRWRWRSLAPSYTREAFACQAPPTKNSQSQDGCDSGFSTDGEAERLNKL